MPTFHALLPLLLLALSLYCAPLSAAALSSTSRSSSILPPFPWAANRPVQLRALEKCCVYQVRKCCPVYALRGSRAVGAGRYMSRYSCSAFDGQKSCIKWEKQLFLIVRQVPQLCLKYECANSVSVPNKICVLQMKREMPERPVVTFPHGVEFRDTRADPLVPDPSYPPTLAKKVPVPEAELRAAEEARSA